MLGSQLYNTLNSVGNHYFHTSKLLWITIVIQVHLFFLFFFALSFFFFFVFFFFSKIIFVLILSWLKNFLCNFFLLKYCELVKNYSYNMWGKHCRFTHTQALYCNPQCIFFSTFSFFFFIFFFQISLFFLFFFQNYFPFFPTFSFFFVYFFFKIIFVDFTFFNIELVKFHFIIFFL